MRLFPAGTAERRIALTALMMFSATVAMANPAEAQTYSATVLGDSPSAFYKLDEPRGAATAANSSAAGASLNGAYRNSVRNGRPAMIYCEQRASWLNGGLPAPISNDCILRGDAAGASAFFSGAPYNPQVQVPMLDESLSYTLEAWVRPDTAGSDGGIIDHGDNGVLALDAGVLTFVAHATDGNAIAFDDAVLSAGTHHVAGTWDNATGAARLYVDGVPAGGGNDVDTANPLNEFAASGSPSLYIGWTNWDGLASFRGLIDNAAVYPSALSAATLFNHKIVGGYSGGGSFVNSLTPEPGSSFSTASTKWASTRLIYDCNVTNCTYSVAGPGGPYNGTSGAGTSVNVALPNGGAGSYTITVTAPGAPNYVAESSYTIGTFSTVITGDAPTAWWRFNEADGVGLAADSSGNGHDGAYQNPSSNGGIGISGDGNAARRFLAGEGGYVGVNGVESKPEAYTIELWFKTSDAGDMALFDHGAHGGGPALYLEGGSIRYRMVDGQILSTPYTSGLWTYVAATWDGVTATLYKDNAAGVSTTSTLSPSGTPALYLGFANVGLPEPAFRGLMDEVSYYGKAFSANRVLNHYLADPPAPEARASSPATNNSGAVTTPVVGVASKPNAVAPDKHAAAAKKAKAKAKARAKARARARAKALAKAKARAKKARANRHRRTA